MMPSVAFRTFEVSDPRHETENLREITVKSAALGARADITVHVPTKARTGTDVPLVILLHGVYGSHWSWVRQAGAHRVAARMQAAGAVPPLVLAMPSDGLWGDGSGYLPHRTQDFERWIVHEVPAAVARAVPAVSERSPLFIAGLSMGGFGALRLGAKYPKLFRAMSGHSSLTHFDQLGSFVEERAGSFTALAEDRSVLETMLRHPTRLPAFRFDCGTDDPLLAPNRDLHAALDRAGVPHTYEEFAGGHEWSYWRRHLRDTLRFFAAILRRSSD